MIVVSDTSPLNYLILIEVVDILPRIYEQVYAPQQVIAELEHPGAPAGIRKWVQNLPDWMHIREPVQIGERLLLDKKLDMGEIHAIALAQELTANLLIDERDAYAVAISYGLTVTGTLGVLDAAAERGLLDLKTSLERLVSETNFRCTQPIIDRLIERDTRRR